MKSLIFNKNDTIYKVIKLLMRIESYSYDNCELFIEIFTKKAKFPLLNFNWCNGSNRQTK